MERQQGRWFKAALADMSFGELEEVLGEKEGELNGLLERRAVRKRREVMIGPVECRCGYDGKAIKREEGD